ITCFPVKEYMLEVSTLSEQDVKAKKNAEAKVIAKILKCKMRLFIIDDIIIFKKLLFNVNV
ncbi:MAG: hypothetical protein WCR53_02145, partial [Bacteroidaceae bacterium]